MLNRCKPGSWIKTFPDFFLREDKKVSESLKYLLYGQFYEAEILNQDNM